jgi:hypothetical protein
MLLLTRHGWQGQLGNNSAKPKVQIVKRERAEEGKGKGKLSAKRKE